MRFSRYILTFSIILSFAACAAAQTLLDVKGNVSGKDKIIRHSGYTASWNPVHKVPSWVSWSITPERLETVVSRNGYSFTEDPALKGMGSSPMDYSWSGYDRGHMCPAADNRFSADAMMESFYMANICPQNHTLNEKTWASLENACRNWARVSEVFVVCGPYFKSRNPKTHIGNNRVAVPDGFWKVVLRLYKGEYRAIGFVYSNEDHSEPFREGAVTVDEVEELTGLDFFSFLDKATEKEVESHFDLKFWN